MNGCDVFDQFIHKNTLRYIPMKNRLSWILKPTLSIIDYELLNSYLLQRECNENAESNYRLFLLKVSQGLLSDCLKAGNEPDGVGRQANNSRNICAECKEIDRKKDSRTRINCSKCGSAVCKAHSNIVCKYCV